MQNISLAIVNQTEAIPTNYITDGSMGVVKAGSPGAPAGRIVSTHGSSTVSARWNHAITALVKLITGEIPVAAADLGPSIGVYLELYGGSKTLTINNQTIQSTGGISQMELIVAVTSYFLGSSDAKFDEVKKLYHDTADQIKTSGKANWEVALTYCYSFFCTIKDTFPMNGTTHSLEDGEELTDEMIKQMGVFASNPAIVDFELINPGSKPEFKNITLEDGSKPTTSAAANTRPIIERCMDGEFIIPFDWDDEQKKQIPSMSFLDLYIPSKDFEEALILIKHYSTKILENMDMGKTGEEAIGNYGKCLAFIGKPGTGKSTMIKALCAACQMPFYPCTATRYSEEDEYQGKTKLDHSNKENKNAAFKFCETPFLNAFEKGGIAVLEEFNIADPGMLMGAIGQAIEKPFILEKDGYLPIVRHPLCFICVTCNVGTQGSQMPSEALFSRNPHVFKVNDPKEEEFVKILAKQSDGVKNAQIKQVFNCYTALLAFLKNVNMPEVAKVITLRHCLAALDEVAAGIDFKSAVERTLINPLMVYAPEICQEAYDSIVGALK